MARTDGAVAISEEKKEAIIAAVSAGLTFKDAAKFAGVSETWMKKERAKNVEWKERCDQAMEAFKLTHLANIAKHSKHAWTASAWLLERTFPEQFNARVALNLTPDGKETNKPNWFGNEMDIKELKEGKDYKMIEDGKEGQTEKE